MRRQRSFRDSDGYRREDFDINFQPVMMTFKAYLQTQDDSITDEEALHKYGEYKLEFQRQQLNEFFVHHKEYEWFRVKYHPTEMEARKADLRKMVQRRLQVFSQLVTDDLMENVRLEDTCQDKLQELMDKFVVLLEGGTEQDYEDIISKENNTEGSVKQLHKTTSIFLNNLHPNIKKKELEAAVQKFPGFIRLVLSEPDQNNKFTRKCWVTFERDAKIREICFGLNNVKIREHDLKPVVNKDLSKRIRPVDWPATEQEVMQRAVAKCQLLIKIFDKKWQIFDDNENKNPVLENIPEDCSDVKILDRLMLYLRLVYSFDFYTGAEYPNEDEMPNRCGMLHVRPSKTDHDQSPKELNEFVKRIEEKSDSFLKEKNEINADLLVKLGLKKEEDEIEKFINASMQEVDSEKWLCTISGKKFKAPEFVRKHIFNKWGEKVDEVKLDVAFFNNYIRDENRPRLPTAPPSKSPGVKRPAESQLRPPTKQVMAVERPRLPSQDSEEPPSKRSIKERLGVGGVKVSYNAKDPRAIVDYSDVDHFSMTDADF